jgi:hypothetical protein
VNARPEVLITEYTVSCLPETSINRPGWEITVEYRGNGRWAVCYGGQCLGRDGTPDWESIPSERRAEWLDQYRFALPEALEMAKKWAGTLRVNGKTAVEVLEWEA